MTSSSPGADLQSLPPVPPSFRWTTETWGYALRCRPLEDVARHLFTTRQLELTDSADVRRLAQALGVEQVVMVKQVHRADVLVVRADAAPIDRLHEADVIVSNDPATAIAVRAADCVPLLLADTVTGSVAAVHAGWRGTAAGAAGAAVESLRREFGVRAQDLIAAIGPSIGPCCYEVGTELVDAFASAGHERYLIDRWFLSPPEPRESRGWSPYVRAAEAGPQLFLDVAGANRDQLVLAGVPDPQIHLSGICTAMNLEFLPSFRAEKVQAGRIAGAITARRL